MTTEPNTAKRALTSALMMLALCSIAQTMRGVQPPLSEDDVLLLLMGSAPQDKKAELIRVHGISSNWGDDFRTRLSALCLEGNVRSALEQEFRRTLVDSQPAPGSAQRTGQNSTQAPVAFLLPSGPDPDSVTLKMEVCAYKRLPTPDKRLLDRIVERLTNSDARLQDLLKMYTFHTSCLIREMGRTGAFRESSYGEWDVMFSDRGKRISHAVANSPHTTSYGIHHSLKNEPGLPLMFFPEDRNDYTFRYVEHVALDQIRAYELSVEPKKVERGKSYFKGLIWVEDRSLQIVKGEGDRVPSVEHGVFEWKFYPHCVTFRSQSTGRFWFPTMTVCEGMADGSHFNSVTRYFQYRKFGSSSVVSPMLTEEDLNLLDGPSSLN